MSDTPATAAPPDERAGILFAGAAYTAWGILPLYWHLLDGVPPLQITGFRILFCSLLVAAITLGRGRWSRLISLMTTRAILRNLVVSAALIACNWTVYVYAVATNQLVEASLGYYILPLISIALGVALFSERMSRVRLLALLLAAIAVTAQAADLGRLPWIALALAFSFGFYGYFRKLTPVDPLDGLMIEMVILLPVTLGLIAYWSLTGQSAFTLALPLRAGLLLCAGPFTAIPLTLFAAGARRIRLSMLGFLQYLAPSITLLIAVTLLGEAFTSVNAITFACVWAALAIVAAEGQMSRFRLKGLAGK